MTKVTITGQGRGVRIRNARPFEIISVLEFVMSKCTTKVALRGVFAALIAVGLQITFANESSGSELFGDTDQARLATYDNAGETHFALSILPKNVSENQRASDIVVYVDTSASQAGVFKRDSIEAVKHLLRNLNAEDRVQIVAVDLDPVPLTQGFAAVGSDDLAVAIEILNQRVSLGSTDMEAMLEAAAKAFPETNTRNKNVVYIGDGISRGSLLQTEIYRKLVTGLADNHIAVSSFAIGPDRNIELMASLANNTGGNLFVDTDEDDSVRQSAIGIASSVHGSVFWPTDGELDDSVVDMFPRRFPPLRTDRDTIVLGTLADREAVELQITGVIDGQNQEMSWTLSPEESSTKFAFLPGMIRDARKDQGLSLPTLGSTGLIEYARTRTEETNRLTDLGTQALASGDKLAAKKLASAAMTMSADPSSTKAALLSMASTYKIQEDDPFGIGGGDTPPAGDAPKQDNNEDPFGGDNAPADQPQEKPAADTEAAPQDPVVVQPATPTEDKTQLPVEPGQEQPGDDAVALPMQDDPADGGITLIAPDDDDEVNKFLQDAASGNAGDVIQTEEDWIKIINQRARKQVEFEQKRGRAELRTNPDAAIERFKNMIEIIDQTPDLYPSTRAELRHSLESALLSSRQRKLEYDDLQALADLNQATALELAATGKRLDRSEQEFTRLIESFNSLIAERSFDAAVDVAQKALETSPDNPVAIVAAENAYFASEYEKMTRLRDLKEVQFQASMYNIEQSTVPFPGDPPLIFPDAKVWREKVKRRAKFQNLRLAGSENDEKILRALEDPANFNYDETPWNEIEEELEKTYGINIVLTSSARDDSLTEDEPITENLTGIRFKNALRIMLKQKNATFVVKDEVLQIISLDDAEDAKWFVTNVYNVGDLVAPRQNFGGGGIGGGGGGFGGGQGGGGFGGGGGGGLQGGGGGGGLFCIQESPVSLKLGSTDKAPAKPIANPKAINLGENNIPLVDWSNYFSDNFAAPADVRITARKLMKDGKATEVVSMIHGAIKNDQVQPWMYEGLVLAMRVAGSPQSEIERALMSAVDLSDDENDTLYAARYMATNGMEKRAIRLLKGFARANPTRTEPFVVGLQAAQKINDVDGIRWATVGIFSQEWPEHPEMVKKAKYASDAIKTSMKKAGQTDELAAYELVLQQAKERDCYVNVTWTGDADLDLFVVEPGGTVCSRLTKRTSSGGVLMGDKFSPKSGLSGQVSEQYILPRGFAGDYRLMIKRVWGQVNSGKVGVSIHNHYNSPDEASMTKQVAIDDKGAMVLFSLDRGRRTEPLEDHQIETVVRRQMSTNRKLLAQTLGDSYSSGAASDYFGGLLGGGNAGDGLVAGNRRNFGGGVVGYQPVITTIPEGTFLTINHATTADRLYVMVSASPTFSQITSVSTFNILGDANTASGVANSGGQQGGGQGGGGFGGGGGGGAGGGGVF